MNSGNTAEQRSRFSKRGQPAVAALVVIWLLCGCSSSPPDLEPWRLRAMNGLLLQEEPSLQRYEELRDESRFQDAHGMILQLSAMQPGDPQVLAAASIAETDAVLWLPEDATEDRRAAAYSALDFAERGVAKAPNDPQLLGQYSFALGSVTHWLPMLRRSSHAETIRTAVAAAFAVDANEPRAHITQATLELRLTTLPWMARLMAPSGDLNLARSSAETAWQQDPNLETAWLYAKVLVAQEDADGALPLVQAALDQPDPSPRDRLLRDPVESWLATQAGNTD